MVEISLPDWTARRHMAVPSNSLAVSKAEILLLGWDRLLVLDPETWKLKRELYLSDSGQLSASPDGHGYRCGGAWLREISVWVPAI